MDHINIGKTLGTTAVWLGVAGFSYLFHSLGYFDVNGAIGLVFLGWFLTYKIWDF